MIVPGSTNALFLGLTRPFSTAWISRASAADVGWQSVTYGQGLYVAVSAGSGASNAVMTSPDGITWTLRTPASTNNWQTVVYGSVTNRFIKVSNAGNVVAYSNDAITWNLIGGAPSGSWKSAAYSATIGATGRYVAVANSGGANAMYSNDGLTWTAASSSANIAWSGTAFGAGLFVSVSADATAGAQNQIQTSPDGITWTLQNTGFSANYGWSSITYGGGKFVAVAGTRSMVSTTGTLGTWTLSADLTPFALTNITYGNGIYVAVSNPAVSTTRPAYYSTDGLTWTPMTGPTSGVAQQWTSVAFNAGRFVAVGNTGTGNRVMTLG